MDAASFRVALIRLNLTQATIARVLHVNKDTVNGWAKGYQRIPFATACLLHLMLAKRITIADLERLHLESMA